METSQYQEKIITLFDARFCKKQYTIYWSKIIKPRGIKIEKKNPGTKKCK
jgi:hypothetical protein